MASLVHLLESNLLNLLLWDMDGFKILCNSGEDAEPQPAWRICAYHLAVRLSKVAGDEVDRASAASTITV